MEKKKITRPSNFKCLEEGCESSFKINKKLVEHLRSVHSIKCDYLEIDFKNIEEFYKWKARIEEEDVVNYIFKSKCGNTSFYYCNRSVRTDGKMSKQDDSVTKNKKRSRLSCKMDLSCTSRMKVIELGYRVRVCWHKSHYGHGKELKHVRLTSNQKMDVVAKIIDGFTPEEIIKSVKRDNRISLLTSQDIQNIKKKYKGDIERARLSKIRARTLEKDSLAQESDPEAYKWRSFRTMLDNITKADFGKCDSVTQSKIGYHISIIDNLIKTAVSKAKELEAKSKHNASADKTVKDVQTANDRLEDMTKSRYVVIKRPNVRLVQIIDPSKLCFDSSGNLIVNSGRSLIQNTSVKIVDKSKLSFVSPANSIVRNGKSLLKRPIQEEVVIIEDCELKRVRLEDD